MKRCYKLLLLIAYLFALTGCGKKEEQKENKVPAEDEVISTLPEEKLPEEAEPEVSENEVSEGTFSFADLKNIEFWFGSGAGGWRTVLTIGEDGSFQGEYSDSEMGSNGEDYQKGTMYLCEFTGQFAEPVQVDEYTYSMKIKEISYKNEPETEEIRDEIKYIYSEPYGLDDAENILIYLPGTPVDKISEECLGWLSRRFYYSVKDEFETLPFYALNNEAHQQGFSSYHIVIEDTKDEFRRVEHISENVEKVLERGTLTQADYNIQSEKLYKLWDDFLNRLWKTLKETKDADFMENLLAEQRAWIEEKEATIEEAGKTVEGGSMESLVRNQKATELTKARVHELMKLLEE